MKKMFKTTTITFDQGKVCFFSHIKHLFYLCICLSFFPQSAHCSHTPLCGTQSVFPPLGGSRRRVDVVSTSCLDAAQSGIDSDGIYELCMEVWLRRRVNVVWPACGRNIMDVRWVLCPLVGKEVWCLLKR